MDGLRERVVRQRARFIEDYDDYVDQARLDLGKLFRIEDYPSKEDLQGKFAIRYRIAPVPDAEHFIAKLASDDTERVKRDIERHIEEQLHDAVGDLYRRLGEAVERVSDRLQEDGNGKPLVFRNSMIENIRDLVDVVPRLNIFGDDELARLGLETDTPDAEGLVISCTNLVTLEALPELERRLGKPVVSANQATVWHSCSLAGITWPAGFGIGRLWATQYAADAVRPTYTL